MIAEKNVFNVFVIFLVSHLIVWTLVPSLSNENLPLDTIEHLAWASNLEWGFDKHPPLVAFILNFFFKIFGNQDWAYYFLSQIFVIIAFLTVYKFADEFFNNKKLALLSVLLLEGIYFYNFTTPEFNVNVCQLPFWALSIYFGWRCIKFEKLLDFAFLGLFISLGILSKYLFIYLVIGIGLLFLYSLQKRKKIKFFNYFTLILIGTLILLPHLIWLVQNNYTTILYGLQRAEGTGSFLDHLIYPIIFLIKQIVIFIPLFIIFFFLIKKLKVKFKFDLKNEKLIFLFCTTIVPILLIVFTSIIMGAKIRTMWMTPFYLFSGVLIIYIFKKSILKNDFKKFMVIFLFLFFLSPSIYLGISLANENKRTDYPGREIARLVQNKWENNFNNEIKFVIGDEWSAGNLSYHLKSRPKWMISLEDKVSKINVNQGVIYVGNPKILKKVCPGVFGEIKPVGYCMIGQK